MDQSNILLDKPGNYVIKVSFNGTDWRLLRKKCFFETRRQAVKSKTWKTACDDYPYQTIAEL